MTRIFVKSFCTKHNQLSQWFWNKIVLRFVSKIQNSSGFKIGKPANPIKRFQWPRWPAPRSAYRACPRAPEEIPSWRIPRICRWSSRKRNQGSQYKNCSNSKNLRTLRILRVLRLRIGIFRSQLRFFGHFEEFSSSFTSKSFHTSGDPTHYFFRPWPHLVRSAAVPLPMHHTWPPGFGSAPCESASWLNYRQGNPAALCFPRQLAK